MRSGDPCHRCESGVLRVYCTRQVGASTIRFLKCSVCNATGKHVANTRIVQTTAAKCPHCGKMIYESEGKP